MLLQTPASRRSDRSPEEVAQLADAYRKAHKAYVLASSLLASWELIGISLDTKEKWGIELKSPNAIPLILFTLVIYFGYKLIIEWQLQHDTAKNRVAELDYRVAHSIAAAAILVCVIQHVADIQIVDLLSQPLYLPEQRLYVRYIFFLAIIVSVAVSVGGIFAWKKFGRLKHIATGFSIVLTLYLVPAFWRADPRKGMAMLAMALGAILSFLRFLPSKTQAASD